MYYSKNEKSFIFASEIKALIASGLVEKELNPDALYHYLTFGSVPSPATILKGVETLLPGHKLIIKEGNLSIKQYWNIEFPKHHPEKSEKEWKEGLREIIDESIRLHMISDVPVGAFLSGGVDSSIITALMSQKVSQPLKTFSIGFDSENADYNETSYAKIVSERFSTDHNEILLREEDVLGELDNIIGYMDQPTHDGINSYFVSKAAKPNITVALSGLGADEIFAGYSIFKYAEMLRKFHWFSNRIPHFASDTIQSITGFLPETYKSSWIHKGILGVMGCCPTVPEQYELVNLFFNTPEKEKLLTEEVKNQMKNESGSSRETLESLSNDVKDGDVINQVSYLMSKILFGIYPSQGHGCHEYGTLP